MTHFDLITADGELWRDLIAAEMDDLNIKEAYLLTAEEFKYLKDKADAFDKEHQEGKENNYDRH